MRVFMLIGLAGISASFIIAFYTLGILQNLYRPDAILKKFFERGKGIASSRYFAIGFGVYSLSMVAGGVDLVYENTTIDVTSQLLGDTALFSMMYFLHRVLSIVE